MIKNSVFKWLLFLIFMLGAEHMDAQIHTNSDTLNLKQQQLVIISSLTATGDLANLKVQLNAALNAGLSVNEIREVLVQLYAYCGFPRSLNAINTFMTVLEDRKSKGITDKEVEEHTNTKVSADQYEQGRKTLEKLTGTPQEKPAPGFGEFAPRIDAFLKAHLFADVFDSKVLTYQQREIATISALAAMTGVESQLKSHLKMGMNTGITEGQLAQLADLIDKDVSRTQANVLKKLINKPALPVLSPDMMVRISEIEIIPTYLEEYKAILKEESAESIRIEPGVISLFAMYQKETPTQVRIVEIYANKDAYQSHLKTPHFQYYKTSTLKMVKSLKLVDMTDVDAETMPNIFKKVN